MNKAFFSRIIVMIMISQLFSIVSSYASNTVVVVDGSGSVAGMSKTRQRNSMWMITEELTKYLSKFTPQDTISIIHFTDKINGFYASNGYTEAIQKNIDSLRFIPKGNTDFSVALDALKEIKGNRRIVFISDGLNNTGTSNDFVCDQLNLLASGSKDEVYFLLLDDDDTNNSIIQCAINSDNITLVKSLSEIPSLPSFDTETSICSDKVNGEGIQPSIPSASQQIEKNVITQCCFDWKCLYVVLIVLVCICIIVLSGFLIYRFWPLFAQASAGAMQKAIFVLYNLPMGLFKVVFKMLPTEVKDFLTEIMPNRDVFKTGQVMPASEQQAKALEAMRKETGKAMRYKNGEIDFRPVSKFCVKLHGSLDSNIPDTLDPRSKVCMAQEAAGKQMLKSKKGRDIIAQYVGKSPVDVTFDDYTCWKDDMLNFGKPNHNPLTPHETIDGQYMQWVPKKYHDVSYGGVSHSGGVSLLKSVRSFLASKA